MNALALVACALAAMNVHAQEPVGPYAARAFTEAKVEAVYGASGPGQDILVKGARPQAENFAKFVLSRAGQDILVKHGFAPGDSK